MGSWGRPGEQSTGLGCEARCCICDLIPAEALMRLGRSSVLDTEGAQDW